VEYLLFTGFVGYLVPWIASVAREHHLHHWVLTANLLLGWTVIGWFAVLVYALKSSPSPSRPGKEHLRVVPPRGAKDLARSES